MVSMIQEQGKDNGTAHSNGRYDVKLTSTTILLPGTLSGDSIVPYPASSSSSLSLDSILICFLECMQVEFKK